MMTHDEAIEILDQDSKRHLENISMARLQSDNAVLDYIQNETGCDRNVATQIYNKLESLRNKDEKYYFDLDDYRQVNYLYPNTELAIQYIVTHTAYNESVAQEIVLEAYSAMAQKNQPQVLAESFSNPVVQCPYCHSINTKKISQASRFLSVGFWLGSSSKLGKQWHCKNCNSDF